MNKKNWTQICCEFCDILLLKAQKSYQEKTVWEATYMTNLLYICKCKVQALNINHEPDKHNHCSHGIYLADEVETTPKKTRWK
jgi:hypothetical protein